MTAAYTMSPDSTDTLSVACWGASERESEPVASFWNALCSTLELPASAAGERVLGELGEYAGNTFVNVFRGRGVAYSEVAYDVAKTLAGVFGDKPFTEGDVASCERFVLGKMGITDDDLQQLCGAVQKEGWDQAVRNEIEQASFQVTLGALGNLAARKAAQKAAEAAARLAAKKAAEVVGKRVAVQVLARLALAFNVVMAVWLVVDLAGPALRKTIPGVVYVALLRKLYEAAQE